MKEMFRICFPKEVPYSDWKAERLMTVTPTSTAPPLDTRIPTEIWGSIFIAALPSPWTFSENSPLQPFFVTPHLIPLVLSAVCRSWRQVACSQPRLWDSCLLSYKHPELNGIWLSRSGERALTLVAQPVESAQYPWCGAGKSLDGQRRAMEAFAHSILPYQQRWQNVKIDIRPFFGWITQRACVQIFQSNSPQLEVFEVVDVVFKSGSPPLQPWLVSIFSLAPSLRELRLPYIEDVNPILLHLPALVDLQISRVRADDALDMLMALPHLQNLRLFAVYFERVNMESIPMITHTNLAHIWLHEDDFQASFDQEDGEEDHAQRSILTRLILPSLCKARIYGVPTDALLSLQDRSSCTLTTLTIDGDWLELDDLLSLLEDQALCSQLQSLEFKGLLCGDGLLQFLTFDHKRPCLRHLKELSFKNCIFRHAHPSPLADILLSRNAGFNVAPRALLSPSFASLRRFSADVLGLLSILSLLDIARLIPLPGPRDLAGHSCSIELKIQSYGPSRAITPKMYAVGRELPDCDI